MICAVKSVLSIELGMILKNRKFIHPDIQIGLKDEIDEYRKSLPVKYFLRFINRNRCTGLWLIESQLEPVDVQEYMKEVAIATKEAQNLSEEALTAAQIAATIGVPVEDVETVTLVEEE